jgi:hypothetical protein
MEKQYCWEMLSTTNQKVVDTLKKSGKELDKFWGITVDPPLVFLVKSRKEIDKFWGRKTESWMSAWTTNGTIFILDPKVYEKESDHKLEHFWKTIKHEYCHLYYRRVAGVGVPRWLNEGLACYLAEQVKKTSEKKVLLRVNDFYDKGGSEVYGLGYFWAKMLVEKFGKAKLMKLLKGMKPVMKQKQFGEHFKKVYGFSLTKTDLSKLVDTVTK